MYMIVQRSVARSLTPAARTLGEGWLDGLELGMRLAGHVCEQVPKYRHNWTAGPMDLLVHYPDKGTIGDDIGVQDREISTNIEMAQDRRSARC